MWLFSKKKEREKQAADDRAKLEALEQMISTRYRGVYKRIDENRELLELLYREAPEFVEKFFWIRGWIESQDLFLTELAEASGAEKRISESDYPRPFPKEPGPEKTVEKLDINKEQK